ncbi:MAG: helix-turn-helix domain containing protein [Caulobacteraceae bacterium]|nr:helix-turn-helix domain containing protein [Caulobacteraceae bacterium]
MTVEFVLEAATQVLERDGEGGFNTNAVAERAGVSIGSVYRYFPNKQAILAAIAEREASAQRQALPRLLDPPSTNLAPDRAVVRAWIRAFDGRARARQITMTAWHATADPRQVAEGHSAFEQAMVDANGRPLSRVAAFVLTRAMHGAMKAAVLEGVDFLLSQEFEDELVQLGRAYRGFGEIQGG